MTERRTSKERVEPLVTALIQAVKMERDEFHERCNNSYSTDALMLCKERVAKCKAAVLDAMRVAHEPSAIDPDASIAIAVSRYIHNVCKDVPHDIGLRVMEIIGGELFDREKRTAVEPPAAQANEHVTAELERLQAPEGPNVAGASSTKIACSCGQHHCHECGEDPAIVGYERTAVETSAAPAYPYKCKHSNHPSLCPECSDLR